VQTGSPLSEPLCCLLAGCRQGNLSGPVAGLLLISGWQRHLVLSADQRFTHQLGTQRLGRGIKQGGCRIALA